MPELGITIHIEAIYGKNFVLLELIKCNNLLPGRELFFYRDQNGVEIDCLIEQGDRSESFYRRILKERPSAEGFRVWP